jgi:hypothetical protein
MKKQPDIATKAELDSRIAARPEPKVEHHLTPGGGVEMVVHQKVDAQNEARIQNLRQRLGASGQDLRDQLSRNKMYGKAKADFDRSR